MKTVTKLSLSAVVAAILGTSAALADDPQLQNRLALQRAQAATDHQTTIAVYAGDRGVGRSSSGSDDRRADTRFELRTNAHGQTFGVFVPVR
ncbi:MAG: hypothetical protein ABI680_08390 [Chthoniobacteraceae bacterium]